MTSHGMRFPSRKSIAKDPKGGKDSRVRMSGEEDALWV